MTQFACSSCDDSGDCDEFASQAVRDVSERCGLLCHSSLRNIKPEALTEYMVTESELTRLVKNGVSKVSEEIGEKIKNRGNLAGLCASLVRRARNDALDQFASFVKTEWVKSSIQEFKERDL